MVSAGDGPTVRRLAILGSTGSIGQQTLQVVAEHPERYRVTALVAQTNVARLAEQARVQQPALAVIGEEAKLGALREALADTDIAVAGGRAAVLEAAEEPADVVVAAIVGAAGLAPTLAAVRQGGLIALANKECLVCAGALVMGAAQQSGAAIVPVDSEHSAIFQVLSHQHRSAVTGIELTASGGPFRTYSRAELAGVSPADAVAHPTWAMGAKISVDSATMMNKGLEVIEAAHLFALRGDDIGVLVHPQSIVHGLVHYGDGSVLAQLSHPDMRTPIALALAWPERLAINAPRLDLAVVASLTFARADEERFPALRLAREALAAGGGAPTVLNAANEVAVAAFLDGRIAFATIEGVIEASLAELAGRGQDDLESVTALDGEARRVAETALRH